MKLVLFHQVGFALWNMSDERAAEVQRACPGVHVVNTKTLDELSAAILDADALCSMRITPELFRAAKKLKWIHSIAAGVGGLMIPEVLQSDVWLTNARGIFSPVIAEHTMAVILLFSRRMHDALRFQWARRWAREELWQLEPPMGEVSGKTLGIVGYGSIGCAIARRAKPLGMKILAVKKNIHVGEGLDLADEILPPDQVPRVLARSDFVVLATPHTPETKRLIGARELAMMQRSAYLINVGRGKVVDESALAAALQSNHIAGAALDVFETEPLPESSGLWTLPNVLLTPHVSGVFPEFWERTKNLLVENIHRFLTGQPLLNRIDKQRGY